ncbi:hypothetical protein Vretimale_2981 [Volvox reticuliferus]|uniref:Myb-like domain-containing protein n=1 Tax=Volvox reticuliferus TaxID=1737510 RepID=A0A8J4G0X3_9CHLO|nr:hypothetical protein Vretifemale_6909 [Volvox reticuliferus]GIL97254.1 hypothetical protein Vretimale_2981 [Volvox reticuliferus]
MNVVVANLQLDGAPSSSQAPGAQQRRRNGKERRLVNTNGQDDRQLTTEMSDLDRERAERMRRNQEMLEKFGINKSLEDLRRIHQPPAASRRSRPLKDEECEDAGSRPAARAKRPRGEVEPMRRSGRLAGAAAAAAIAEVIEKEAGDKPAMAGRGVGIMTQEEYLKSKGLSPPDGWFRSDGQFRGWVKQEVVERLRLASSAAEAWEQCGGGKFQRKINKADVPSHLKAKGWSDARAFAASQLHKNPNSYFYRHTAPGEPQAQGEWTRKEHDLFVEIAKRYGVGDKWGLFASYIPNRVGYQCSAYYTQVIIPSGLILDDRYRMDAWGDAVYVGARGGMG